VNHRGQGYEKVLVINHCSSEAQFRREYGGDCNCDMLISVSRDVEFLTKNTCLWV